MIEVGEYVRTKNKGIKKIDTIFENRTVNRYGYEIGSEWDGKLYSTIKTTDIVKHSKNIIDLIEEGDYVNGKRVFETENRINDNGEKVVLTENYDEWTDDGVIANKDIEIILTKEQYLANCYKVGGEDETSND